jgi:hypothetical protein
MEKKMSDVAEIMNFEEMSIAALVDLKEQIAEMIGLKRAAERKAVHAAERAEMAERGELKAVGRPENTGTFDDKWGIAEGLKLIAAKDGFYHYDDVGAAVSRVLTLQLVERGLVETHKTKVTAGPGRAKMFYRLTVKGKEYRRNSNLWKKQPQ